MSVPRQIILVCVMPFFVHATKEEYKTQPFEHYRTILDRMPFGPLPPHFGEAPTTAEPTKTDAQVQAEQQNLAKQINMSCINVTPGGKTAIGFTDLTEKPQKNYYLLIGDSGGGWTVVSADYDEEWAQIEKDGVTITLKLGKGLIDGPPAAAEKGTAVAATPQATPSVGTDQITEAQQEKPHVATAFIKRPSLGGRPNIDVAGLYRSHNEAAQLKDELEEIKNSGGNVASYVQRLRERKKQEKEAKDVAEQAAREQLKELARKVTEEELKKNEHEINMNLVEQGARPISDIELTPEEEAQLVEKGLLTQ